MKKNLLCTNRLKKKRVIYGRISKLLKTFCFFYVYERKAQTSCTNDMVLVKKNEVMSKWFFKIRK